MDTVVVSAQAEVASARRGKLKRMIKGSKAAKAHMAWVRGHRKKAKSPGRKRKTVRRRKPAKTPKRKAGRQHSPPARKGKPGKGKAKRTPGRQKSPPARKKTPKRK